MTPSGGICLHLDRFRPKCFYFIGTIIYPSDTGGYDLYRSLSPRFSSEGV